jgi:hypothetical protein
VITPSIVSPSKTGLVLAELDLESLKVFAGIGKSLQQWANKDDQSSKEGKFVMNFILKVMNLAPKKRKGEPVLLRTPSENITMKTLTVDFEKNFPTLKMDIFK